MATQRRSVLGAIDPNLEPRRQQKKLSLGGGQSGTSKAPRRTSTSRASVGGGRQSMGGRQSLGLSRKQSMGGRQSTTGGRPSTGRRSSVMSRRSSIHSTMAASGDPRPLSDPAFKSSCIRNLIKFLSEHGYQYAISPKMLASPSDQEVYQIFQFLYNKVDPAFQFPTVSAKSKRKSTTGRADAVRAGDSMVEKIPVLLKELGYPFKINKSAVISCGSHSNWPKMLGALHFLLEIATLQETVDISTFLFSQSATGEQQDFEDTETTEQNMMMFDYLADAYSAWLDEEDDIKAKLDEEMLGAFQAENDKLRDAHVQALKENEAKVKELQELQASARPLDQKQQINKDLSEDVKKFETLIANLDAHRVKIASKLEASEREYQLRLKEKESYVHEKARLQNLHDNQELKPSDVERIRSARKTLDSEMSSVQQRKEDIEQRAWKQEVILSKELDEVRGLVGQYNKRAEQLQIIPAESKLAAGVDFEVRFNSLTNQKEAGLLQNDISKETIPALHQLKDRLTNSVHAARHEIINLEESGTNIDEKIQDKSRKIVKAETKLQAAQSAYQQEKATMDSEQQKLVDEVEKLQREAEEFKADSSKLQGTVSQERQNMLSEEKRLESQLVKERTQINNMVFETLKVLTEHKARIQEFVKEYQATVKEAEANSKVSV